MSKSRGNTISPAEYVRRHGADATRTFICFMGPPEKGGDWTDEGVEGVHRFLSRLWRLGREVIERAAAAEARGDGAPPTEGPARDLLNKAHWAIQKATRDIRDRFQFNTAIAAVMELVNDAYRLKDGLYGDPAGDAALRFATSTAASLLFPFAPHLGAEVYEWVTGRRVWEDPWPEPDPELLARETFTLVVQVNGKLRDRVEADVNAADEELVRIARGSERVRSHIDGKQVVKEIVVPGKLVNLVVR
jgi:leucyl-tRNA synthetase